MTQTSPRSTSPWLGAAVLGLTMAACGLGNASNTTPGQAFTDAPVAGTIILYDASLPMQARTASMRVDGSFDIQTTGLTLPYLLRAQWSEQGSTRQLYGVSEGDDNLDINGFTDLAYGAACLGRSEELFFRDSDAEAKRGAADRSRALLITMLQSPLAPLFQRYGITDPRADRAAVRRLLADVIVSRPEGVVSFDNRSTGRVFFVGQLGHLELGTFTAANMPPGPAAPTCTAFTYADFAACQPDNTQVRTVLTSSPPGCTGGSPATTQACTYIPPVTTCTAFTYSPYGACQPNSTQVRTVLTSNPPGCTGGSPITTRACTYVPPVTTCTDFIYSPYEACLPDNTQVRTVLGSGPPGCTGGSPVTTQACTYVPPVITCIDFTYSPYDTCQPDNTQVRIVLTSGPPGCTGGSPVTTTACIYVAPVCTLATAVPSCITCHGALGSGTHLGRPLTCAICHGPVDNGSGTPSTGMTAALFAAACQLTYPTAETHNDGTINLGTAF